VNLIQCFGTSALVVATGMLACACETTPQPQAPAATAFAAYPGLPPGASGTLASAAQGSGGNALVTPLNVAPNSGTAAPMDPLLAGAAGAILDKVAGNLAPGMSREGPPMAATFQPGQTMEQLLQLQSGRCYTVVASGPTVQSWDFALVLNGLPVSPVLTQEAANGATASLGGNGNCFRWNFLPAQARVIVKVTQGGGVAVAQVYGK
jgi:hypothetical protein